MATATKAIGALREAGLVETIPGSGTIVRHRNQLPATPARSARLSQREIVDAGVRMADSVFGGIRLPEIPVADWRRRLDAGAHLFWSVFSRHPWAAEVISLSRP